MAEPASSKAIPSDVFFIILLIVIASGSLLISLSFLEAFIYFADQFAFLFFLTALVISLLFSLLSAYWKYEKDESDKKSNISLAKAKQYEEQGKGDEKIDKAILIFKRDAQNKSATANKFSNLSGTALKGSLLSLFIGFVFLLVSIWSVPFSNLLTSHTAEPEQTKIVAEDAEDAGEDEDDEDEEDE